MAIAAIKPIASQRKTSATIDMAGADSIFKNEMTMASVAIATVAARILLFIRAERYAGRRRVSMVKPQSTQREAKKNGRC